MDGTARDLAGRRFVVTGGNTGIGRVTALELARRGAAVVIASRSAEKTEPVVQAIREETGNDAVSFRALDLTDLASVRACADGLLAEDAPIHVLVNNAGMAGQRGTTRDGFELAFGVNHLGPYLLTRLLLDRIRASAPARIVNVSSKAHLRAKGIDWEALRRPTRHLTGFPEYAVSKLCNVLFTKELARRLEGTGVTTYALHPGVIASDIWRKVPWPVRPILKLRMKTVEEGARTTLSCAAAPEVAGESGRYYDDERERAPSPLAEDEALARRLWDESARWVGLDP